VDEGRLAALRDEPIHPEEKGFGGPLHRSPVTAAMLSSGVHSRDGWLSSPRPVLSQPALRHNIETMAAYCSQRGITLFPHAKTAMAPQLVAAQIAAGAPGITVATVAQARLFRQFGVDHILVANQVVDAAAVEWLAVELVEDPGCVISCYVDSIAGVDLLQDVLSRHGARPTLDVLVECGHPDGRTGARTAPQALGVAAAVARSPRLRLAGVAGYEGSLVAPDVATTVAAARTFIEQLAAVAARMIDAGLFDDVPIVTAGGSAYFDVVADVLGNNPAWQLVTRSGCYLAHDHGLYAEVSPFGRSPGRPPLVAALEVWAPVLSRPEPGVVVVGAGRRDVSFDAGLPVLLTGRRGTDALSVEGAVAGRLFDQHLVVAVPDGCELAPGDEVALGISHPCTTFDKWRWLPLVDGDDLIVDVVRTFF
jgi:D-serine deaminase-like pyridoxal phosphate-dependent protein